MATVPPEHTIDAVTAALNLNNSLLADDSNNGPGRPAVADGRAQRRAGQRHFGPGNLLELLWELFLPYDATASFLGTPGDLASGSPACGIPAIF